MLITVLVLVVVTIVRAARHKGLELEVGLQRGGGRGGSRGRGRRRRVLLVGRNTSCTSAGRDRTFAAPSLHRGASELGGRGGRHGDGEGEGDVHVRWWILLMPLGGERTKPGVIWLSAGCVTRYKTDSVCKMFTRQSDSSHEGEGGGAVGDADGNRKHRLPDQLQDRLSSRRKKKERVENEVGTRARSRSIESQDRERVGREGRGRGGKGGERAVGRRDRGLDEQQTSAAYEQDMRVGNARVASRAVGLVCTMFTKHGLSRRSSGRAVRVGGRGDRRALEYI